MTIKVTDSGLMIGQKRVPLLSGSMHYWRIARTDWEKCLSKVKALGFSIVCPYVPWSVHELSPGEFDFGEMEQRKDLGAFLRMAQSLGLYVMLRPGPHINVENIR